MTEQYQLEPLAVPAEFVSTLGALVTWLRRLDEPWRPHHATDVWISELKAAGVQAKHATGAWAGKYRAALPFVIELPCPFDHRTEDRRDYAKVRLIVDDDGWVGLDADSPCMECDAASLETYLLTCPLCEVGDDSDDHDPEHEAFCWEDGDRSILARVQHEMKRRAGIARARVWVERYEEAVHYARADGMDVDRRVRTKFGDITRGEFERRWAQERLGTGCGAPLATKEAPWTVERAVDWLDRLTTEDGAPLVLPRVTQREALRLTEGMVGRPPKNVLEKAQSVRKARSTGD
ncbi:hypothetical protein KZX37_08300 [Microbacterium sp. EYE_5]|uniref:hypothetical protein n=1 Tax=unclassified Microbacterium TaxID=2609290 RepID=UPI002003B2DC|nr:MULTISPECIES: hypothetical protein [unclassified Microbacterium]MCK6081485.1 hypothetical protein [Microbacterium sp. EYE_382]MCK6086755.1 hypothetical protein [Microbacterium sp. EYE_384]MCK6123747.1 hypothetical protein [Microbacterium sp. EYE_80]MCK6126656.1 hypothetical protein [Microbacterium sp. EYE_79]MCK6142440.1 hypothetical protein [Microbacterium sp. EYE_39]